MSDYGSRTVEDAAAAWAREYVDDRSAPDYDCGDDLDMDEVEARARANAEARGVSWDDLDGSARERWLDNAAADIRYERRPCCRDPECPCGGYG